MIIYKIGLDMPLNIMTDEMSNLQNIKINKKQKIISKNKLTQKKQNEIALKFVEDTIALYNYEN
jgi:hypothetical protein